MICFIPLCTDPSLYSGDAVITVMLFTLPIMTDYKKMIASHLSIERYVLSLFVQWRCNQNCYAVYFTNNDRLQENDCISFEHRVIRFIPLCTVEMQS